MEQLLKNSLKKYILYGLVVSIVLLVLNYSIGSYFFPKPQLISALFFYVLYIFLTTLLSAVLGLIHYKLFIKNQDKKGIYYFIFIAVIIVFAGVALVILYILNFLLAFSRSF